MIDHASIAVRDLERAAAFYEVVLARISYTKIDVRPTTIGFGKRYSELWLNHGPDMFVLTSDSGAQSNGVHVCLRAPTAAAVDGFHAAALAARRCFGWRARPAAASWGWLLCGLHPRSRRKSYRGGDAHRGALASAAGRRAGAREP
jgi:hypothetical protein